MGTEANTAEQTPAETTPEHVEALLEAARYDDLDDVVSLATASVLLDSKDSLGRTVCHEFVGGLHVFTSFQIVSNEFLKDLD